jgi:hypothetical protein
MLGQIPFAFKGIDLWRYSYHKRPQVLSSVGDVKRGSSVRSNLANQACLLCDICHCTSVAVMAASRAIRYLATLLFCPSQ